MTDARPSIVAVVAEATPAALRARLERLSQPPYAGHVIAEVRLDALGDPAPDVITSAPRSLPILATCRRLRDGGGWAGSEDARRNLLRTSLAAGAREVDVEIDVLEELDWARGDHVVASFHDFNGTPADVEATMDTAFALGAGRVKVATRVLDLTDVMRLSRAVKECVRPDRVTAFGLGPVGVATRLLFRRMGADRVYARFGDPLPKDAELAPGLPELDELVSLYYPGPSVPSPVVAFGVLGDRAGDSIGPVVFNRIFRARGVPSMYVPLSSPTATGLREAMRLFGLRGLSVTIPHKEAALRLADEVHDLARRIGAANTLVSEGGALLAYNTDYHGVRTPVRQAFESLGVTDARGKSAVVVGAGGAARAAVVALQDLGLDVGICSRTEERARELADAVGAKVVPMPDGKPDVLVNATPVGGPRDPKTSPVPAEVLGAGQIVFEMNYLPARTALLDAADAAGATIVDGARMFALQAAQQLHHFWSGLPDMRDAIDEEVRWAISQRESR